MKISQKRTTASVTAGAGGAGYAGGAGADAAGDPAGAATRAIARPGLPVGRLLRSAGLGQD